MRKIAVGISLLIGVGISIAVVWGLRAGHEFRIAGSRAHSSSRLLNSGAFAKAPTPSSVALQYAKLPIAFEPNLGQTDPEAKYIARGLGYELFLTPKESVFVLNNGHKRPVRVRSAHGTEVSSLLNSAERPDVLRMRLLGANATAAFTSESEMAGKRNYISGKRPEKWHTNVPTFGRVTQHQTYAGIDLTYYGNQGQLEYDFIIQPGADPQVIHLGVQGGDKVRTDADGNLLVTMSGGEIRFQKPFAYQQNGAEKTVVAADYVLKGKDVVGFHLGNYDPRRELIIDPILSYSTYLGGSNIDGANSIAVAPDKTAFIAGGTFSTDFPTAGTHPLQPNHGGSDDFSKDAFVAKLSADGMTVLYATYLGGARTDFANGIAVDNAGEAFVVGTTISDDFPVTFGSFNTECGGDGKCGATFNTGGLIVENGFICKLNAAGSALIYSAYIGEYENVEALGVAVDQDQNAYVTGHTEDNFLPTVTITPPNVGPPNFPITFNAFQPFFGGGTNDAFVMKISATGLSILYSSYLGGLDEDSGHGIAVDLQHNAYVTGLTYSTNLPLVTQVQSLNGGAGDGFVAKVNTNTNSGALIFSSYVGGAGLDQSNAVAVDGAGDTYITGVTNSTSLATAGVSQPLNGGQGDAFVAKYSTSQGSPALVYFTYLGGTKADSGGGIAVDSAGNAYVAGTTVSTDFKTTADAFQKTYGGGNADAFIAKLDPAGATLLYASYLGGTNTESGNAIAIDSDDPPGAYVAGQTCSPDFPLSNPAQASYGGKSQSLVWRANRIQRFQWGSCRRERFGRDYNLRPCFFLS